MPDGNAIIIGQANTTGNPGNETSLSRNENTAATVFVARNVNLGDGIHGESVADTGVRGLSSGGGGVTGRSDDSDGVSGTSTFGTGVVGGSYGRSPGVWGGSSSGTGVRGTSDSGAGVEGSSSNTGVSGRSTGRLGTGVVGFCSNGMGMLGRSISGPGVWGSSSSLYGVVGESLSNTGVRGVGYVAGVYGRTTDRDWLGLRAGGVGVFGSSPTGIRTAGVWGDDPQNVGVGGISRGGVGVYGRRRNGYDGNALGGVAGFFDGGIKVVNGPKNFQIDHPLDPENKYLVHTCVESSEMKNVYDGDVQLDEDGAAWVDLPDWFGALNEAFRYQLTAVGSAAPDLHVAEEISENSENRFKIAGGEEGLKVCWQVTGSRKDPWAAANPFEVEQEKPEEEQGRYLAPSLHGASEEQRVMMGPIVEAVEEEQRPPEPSDIDLASLEEEHGRQLDELRRQEAEHRREMEELEEEAPPEST